MEKKMNTEQGHWILAKMGKRVLRPGGKELTQKLISNLQITTQDDVVELAPGFGFTAAIALESKPKTYTGIELNEEAATILRKTIFGPGREIIVANAAESGLPDGAYTKVYGEAMLTMHSESKKSEIIREAYRILKPGGRYGIHELSLFPDELSDDKKTEIQHGLAAAIKVNARPLTQEEWIGLIEQEGFRVVTVETRPMHLLQLKRMIADEGVFRTLKILFNILTHPKERGRIRAMRDIFKKYENQMNAISIVCEKA